MIDGIVTRLKEVTEVDALDIINLRNDPAIGKYLSGTSKIGEQEQKEWIKKNKSIGDGIYWVISDKDEKVYGTISLYNVNDGKAEFGRYICTQSAMAIESELLLLEFGFNEMNLEEIFCRTVKENNKVWKQHYKFGFKDVGFEQFPDKGFTLLIQSITKENFLQFDYAPIKKIIKRFS